MVFVKFWKLPRVSLMITKMLLNKFDCFIVIEGNRGLGKSTLGWEILTSVNQYFAKIRRETGDKNSPYKEWYRFKPKEQLRNPDKNKFIIYKQEDVINFFDKWHYSGLADEMINATFNRDFWSENQKNIIKIMNMNRDHCNLLIACVPQFQTLDTQIKNLCKLRITVVRRGLAVIQSPNRSIYIKDRWDSANNERIEREWYKRGTGLPQYSKLNTYRGMLKFKALSYKEQEVYDAIKFAERNLIKKDLGVTNGIRKEDDMFEKVYNKFTNGAVKNSAELEGVAFMMNTRVDSLKDRIKKRLSREGKIPIIAEYYYEKKAKKEPDEITEYYTNKKAKKSSEEKVKKIPEEIVVKKQLSMTPLSSIR